jgi:UPF0755 protein
MEYMTGAIFNIIFIILAIVAVSFVGTRAYAYGMDLFRKDMNVAFEEFVIEIPEDPERPGRADALHAGRVLEQAGLTPNAWVFYLQSRLNGTYRLFRPGTYAFNTHMDDIEIMDMMQRAVFIQREEVSITIREGSTLRQIGEQAESMGLFTLEEWLYACANYGATFSFLADVAWRENPLEGYLFPDTYFLPQNPTPNDLINRMLNRFIEIFDYQLEDRAYELNLTIDQVIIKASIIEKEIRVASERALCSAIIHNRLRLNMPLQMCSTIIYVLDVPRSRLFTSDLDIVSPYNTYRNPGLPIGPISNPGRAAIMAALYPADASYLFMVLANETTGEHFFTHDYNEHLRARDRYNRPF